VGVGTAAEPEAAWLGDQNRVPCISNGLENIPSTSFPGTCDIFIHIYTILYTFILVLYYSIIAGKAIDHIPPG